ncbi:hypothetical protein [Piscinibacter sp. HJYY11]|uniref:hypothetical protein n=1 Tax=Piscinibacter sp. HJYY11 TaxID=2801333 RepID=UPI00191FE14B|nr:hypothetical protein [Piscinibacter sp. HJYY11]MBL0726079.1 hypothetical protein [Piscinibacter sp. HJYY11]
MTGVDVQEISLDDQYRLALAHDTVKKHFAAAIEHFDEEFGPGTVLEKPELLAVFVHAAAMESLASAIAGANARKDTSTL